MTFIKLSLISIDHHLLTHLIEHVPQVVDLSFSEIELEEQFTPVTSFSEHEQSPINLGVDDPVDFDTGIPRAKAYALELARHVCFPVPVLLSNFYFHRASPGFIRVYYTPLISQLHKDSEPIGDSRRTVTNLTTPRSSRPKNMTGVKASG